MEWATPTLPDLTINLKQCSVQLRSLKDPEAAGWISWFLASRLDPTGANGRGRLEHAPQILWKQNRDVLFLTHSCLKLAIKHPSLSTFSVCLSGADQENHSLLQNPEVKFCWAPQRYRLIFIFSHKHHRAKQSKQVLEGTLYQQSPSPKANAAGCKRNKTPEMSELRAKLGAGSAVLLNALCHFLSRAKMLMLQFVWLEEPHEHPIFPASVKTDLWAKPGWFFYGGNKDKPHLEALSILETPTMSFISWGRHLPFTNTSACSLVYVRYTEVFCAGRQRLAKE